jgi:hypothetical protein
MIKVAFFVQNSGNNKNYRGGTAFKAFPLATSLLASHKPYEAAVSCGIPPPAKGLGNAPIFIGAFSPSRTLLTIYRKNN